MKVTIEFNEEEEQEAKDALNAGLYKVVLWDLSQKFRRMWKYSEDEHEIEHGEKLAEFLKELLNDYQINLE